MLNKKSSTIRAAPFAVLRVGINGSPYFLIKKGEEMKDEPEITKEAVDAEIVFTPAPAPSLVQTQTDRFVEMALQSGDMERLEKMLDLKERFDKEESRKQFTAALAEFKAEDMNIVKDRNVSFTTKAGDTTSYTHASLGNIVKLSVPIMSKHGLSHRWLTEQLDKGVIRVTCILTHKGGHSESTSLQAAPDDSGKKNNIQRVSSTITYLERYTYLAITGLAVEEQDDDGQGAGAPAAPAVEIITGDQIKTLDARITDNNLDSDLFTGWLAKKCPYTMGIVDKLAVDNYDMVLAQLDKTIKLKHEKEDV